MSTAPKLKMHTDVVSYRKQVERYAMLTGRGLKETMEEGVSIMAGQLAKRFPPKTKGQGLRAIKNDLSRIINSEMKAPEIENAMDLTGDDRYDPDGVKIQDWHESRRFDNRLGHMRPRSIRGRDRLPNGWMASRKLHAPKSAVNKYAKRRGEKVGELKAHWTKATQLYRGAARLPAWVTRHGAKGIVNNRMKRNGDGYIEVINPLPYSSNWKDINNFVVKSQGRMFQAKIRAELKKQTDRENRRSAA